MPPGGEGDSPAMVTYGARQRARLPALRAGWLAQTFVHWPHPARTVQALVPAPPVVQDCEGSAWVGFTPFVTADGIGAPYRLAALGVSGSGGAVVHSGRGRADRSSCRPVVRPGAPIRRPTCRDVWLTARRRAYPRRFGTLWETPAEHEPRPLAAAAVEALEEDLTVSAGPPAPSGGPATHFSEGVGHVRLGVSRPVPPAPARS